MSPATMTERGDEPHHPLNVIVVTPLGPNGKGGIDRLMDLLRAELALPEYADISATFLTSRGSGPLWLSPVYLVGTMAGIVYAALRGKADLVHINLSDKGSTYRKLIIAWLCRRLHVRHVVHVHGAEFREFWNSATPAFASLLASCFERSAKVVVLGQVWRDFIGEKVLSAAIAVIPNGVPMPAQPYPTPGSGLCRILFLGRHGDRKGVLDLVRALQRMASDPGWRAVLAGDGTYQRTQQEVGDCGLSERVEVPGWVDPDVRLREADVLVLPSYDENLPVCVIEAMSRGVAVVTTPVGAVTDIIEHERSGLLIPPGDIAALADALSRMVNDRDLRERLAANARQTYLSRLTFPAFTRNLIAVWREAAEKPASRTKIPCEQKFGPPVGDGPRVTGSSPPSANRTVMEKK